MKLKKIITGILIASLTLTSVSIPTFAEFEATTANTASVEERLTAVSGNYEYEIDEDDGTVTITKYNGNEKKVTVPSKLGGKTVAVIGESCFSDNTVITSVVIPDSIKVLERSCFYNCTALSSVSFGKSVTKIESNAFARCSALKSVSLPASLTRIDTSAFNDTPIMDSQKGSVKYIGKWLMYADRDITSLTVKDGTIGIADYAMEFCRKLTTVSMPDSVKNIGCYAFFDCQALTKVNISKGVKKLELSTFSSCSALKSITIPDSVTVIDTMVFHDCTSLSDVKMSSNIVEIGSSAFVRCTSLKSITIPAKVKEMGVSVFEDCTALESVKILNGVGEIGAWAFTGCSALKSITIPTSVKEIGMYAFEDCTALSTVNTSEGLEEINTAAFKGCTALKSIVIPKSVTFVGYRSIGYTNGATSEDCKKIDGFKIYCFKNTEGYEYATKNGFAYNVLNGAVVKGVSTSTTANKVRINWNKSSGAAGYVIYRYKDGKWVKLKTVTSGTTALIEGLSPSTKYTFRICAYKKYAGNNYYGDYNKFTAITKPSKVTGLKCTGKSDSVVKLSWNKNTSATGYIIEQYKGNKWVRIAKIENNATTTYRVTGLSASTRNAFRIQAYKEYGTGALKGAYTDKFVVYTKPKAMTGFKASAKTKNTITLSWNKNATATGYIIEQYKGDKWVRIATIKNNTTVSYKVTGLKANTRYAFRIQGYKNIPGSAVRTDFTNKLVVYTTK